MSIFMILVMQIRSDLSDAGFALMLLFLFVSFYDYSDLNDLKCCILFTFFTFIVCAREARCFWAHLLVKASGSDTHF